MTTEVISTLTAGVTRHHRTKTWIKYVILTVVALPWVVLPLWMLIVNSFKTTAEASPPTIGLPTTWNILNNYRTVIVDGDFFLALRNSVMLAVPSILAVLLLGTMAAWVYARTTSVSLRVTYYIAALSIILPPAIIPTVFVLSQIGLNGTLGGYMLTVIGTRLGVVIFLATGFIRALPVDYEEAAQLDGASRWRVYWHVILPLLSPLLFTAAIMLIISIWNDFFFALFLLRGQDSMTLPLALFNFASQGVHALNWNYVFADVVLTSLPLIIVYVIMQRRVLSGLTEGGVTG